MRPRWWRSEAFGPVLLALPFVLGLEIAGLSSASVPLTHHWETTLAELNGSYPVLHPLVAAIAAAAFVPFFSPGHRELTVTLPGRGIAPILLRAAFVGGWLVAVHLLVTLVVVIWAWRSGTPGRPDVWAVLPGVGGILAATGVGVGAARLLPHWWTPPLLAVGGYLTLLTFKGLLPTPFYRTGGTSLQLYGLAYRPDVASLQLLSGAAVAVALVAVTACSRRDLALPRQALAAMFLVVLVLGVGLGSRGDRLYHEVPVAWHCVGGAPRLCAVREDAALAATARKHLVQAVAAVRTLDAAAEIPDTFRQPVGQEFRHDDGVFSVEEDTSQEQSVLDVLQSVSPCSDHWTGEQVQSLDTVLAYLVPDSGAAQSGVTPSVDEARGAARALLDCR